MTELYIFLQAEPSSGVSFFLPMILILLVFYFFMIRPQINKRKEEEKFQSGLKKGDKVITIGGIHGKVNGMKDNEVILEISNNTKIIVNKNALSSEKSLQDAPKK